MNTKGTCAEHNEEEETSNTPLVQSADNADGKHKRHGGHATSLTLFVAIAILLDVCLGIIELPHHEVTAYGISMKVLSAIFLGCICFFTGKFFENYREQQLRDVDKMGEITERLHQISLEYHRNKAEGEDNE